MTLTRFLSLFTLVLFCSGLMIESAEAKRFGGGRSFGKSFVTQKRVTPAPAQRQTTQQKTTADQKAAAGATNARPGMGGMLGGLLAGGLLGALFFGGAFEGIQLMDILLIGLLAFVLFKLFAARRPQPAPAGAGSVVREMPAATAGRGVDAVYKAAPIMSAPVDDTEVVLPSWFNRESFLEGARQHFAELQRAWTENDLETIRSYCTAELYDSLVEERRRLGQERLDNDLVSVMCDIVGYSEEGDEAHLSINFYGWMREGVGNETTEFNEIWHLIKDLRQPKSDWYIAGIEQA